MQRLWRVAAGASLAALLIVVGVASADTEEKPEAPAFRVEKADIVLGTVVAGTDAVATFVFHNDTDKDVKIIKAKPS